MDSGTEKENVMNQENNAAAQAEEFDKAESTGAEQVETMGAEELIKLADAKAKEYKELAQRVQAEFDNYRKRNNESVKAARAEGHNDLLVSMLPVIDSVETAMKMVKEQATVEGIALIYKQLKILLQKYEVEEIAADGQAFDHNYHNAVALVDSGESGKIIEVMQKGYTRSGKVLRYAMVKVAR